MDYKFGVSLVCDDLEAFPGWVRTVEKSGFSMIGLTDSPALYPETYVTGVICAQNTSRVRFGPRVTNPITRHPIVSAAAIASLDVLAEGRTIFGIGAGDSAAHTAGERPARVADIEDYMLAVRGLLRGEKVTYRGKTLEMFWARRDVPLYLAAAGPKMLRMAGRIADGVIIGTGVLPEVVEHSIALIREGAEEAGRDWRQLDLWWLCGCRIEESRAVAEEKMLSLTAALINAHFQVTLEGKRLPDELRADVQELVDRYDFDQHVKHTTGVSNAQLLDSLPGLRQYASARYLVGGTPEDCAEQIRAAGAAGARQFWWTASFSDKMSFVRRFGDEVMPLLQ